MRHIQKTAMAVTAVLIFLCSETAALERMTNREMGGVTAQGGITLALEEVLVYNHVPSLTLTDVGTLDSQGNPLTDGYLTGELEALFSADLIFSLDIGSHDPQGSLLFYGNALDIPAISISQEYGEAISSTSYDDISVWNHQLSAETHLGDLSVTNATLMDSQFELFSPVGDGNSGVRMLAEVKKSIDSISFSTTDGYEDDLVISGVMIGGSFSGAALPEDNQGIAPIDTSSWTFDENMFRSGIPHHDGDPVSLADHENTTLSFAIDVSNTGRKLDDGTMYVSPHLVIQSPMEGSFRIQSVSSGDFDYGPIAIDGIRLYKNLIEFPGRGIGN